MKVCLALAAQIKQTDAPLPPSLPPFFPRSPTPNRLKLISTFSSEMTQFDFVERVATILKESFSVDRVGLFWVDRSVKQKKPSLILMVSEKVRNIKLPMKGLAGVVAQTGQAVNVRDAYEDGRFDNTMDKRTSYRTRQVLAVPIREKARGSVLAVIQLVNLRKNGRLCERGYFTKCDEELLFLVGKHLGQVLGGSHRSIASGRGEAENTGEWQERKKKMIRETESIL